MADIQSSYNPVARMYHELWADFYLPAAMPALEQLFFSELPLDARVLDVCCGSGHVTRELVKRGYRVTGVDASAELIELARHDLPDVDFHVQDVTELALDGRFDAALSTFDSLNHILTLEGLFSAFARVRRVLKRGGLFVFDMNLDEAYAAETREWSATVSESSIGLVRGAFDRVTQRAATELIWFVPAGANGLWEQRRSVVEQRTYPQTDILRGLHNAGFRTVEPVTARKAGVTSGLGFGRVFYVARA